MQPRGVRLYDRLIKVNGQAKSSSQLADLIGASNELQLEVEHPKTEARHGKVQLAHGNKLVLNPERVDKLVCILTLNCCAWMSGSPAEQSRQKGCIL